jgi:hypothetical protein
MKTWYTQPEESYSSFYYYQDDTREFVRIRLALNKRPVEDVDTGATYAFYRSCDKRTG